MSKFKQGQLVKIRENVQEISSDLTREMIQERGKCYLMRKICFIGDDTEIYLDIPTLQNTYWKEEELMLTAVNKGRFTNVKE